MFKRLIIIDISSFIFRAFYAIRPLHSPEGTPVNAVYGVLSMLLKLLSLYSPGHIFIAKDTGEKTFRNDLYPEYKSHRPLPPEDLIPQFELIDRLLVLMKLPCAAKVGYEADDIIGSAVTKWKDCFEEILIASGDKDLMQLIEGNVKMVDTMKNITYDQDKVKEKLGVWPNQVVDYLAMIGDSSDNIPGMKGIGPKSAIKLLDGHETLDRCIACKETFKGKKLTTAFSEHLDNALLSRKLVTIIRDLSLGVEIDDLAYSLQPSSELISFLHQLDFKSSIAKLDKLGTQNKTSAHNQDSIETTLIDSEHLFEKLEKQIEQTSRLAMEPFFDTSNICTQQIVGIGLSLNGKNGFYLPFRKGCLTPKHLHRLLDITYARTSMEICSSKSQETLRYLIRENRPYKARRFDLLQAHFIVNPDKRHTLDFISREYLDLELPSLDKKQLFYDLDLKQAAQYAGPQTCMVFQLVELLKTELKEKELTDVYCDIDGPTLPVLAKMEVNGVMINREHFMELEEGLDKKIEALEKKMEACCQGYSVNFNSPKQVAHLLFNKLGFPVIKKTKTGPSTDMGVLQALDAKNIHPFPGLLLQYRELGKLLSTYVRTMPELVNSTSGRVHTHFYQHVAATGRLSSANPNLQNIPIRTEMGGQVRKGFIARPGLLLLGADYSQVELRLLAHLSRDPVMLEAFKNDQDIHRQTASEVLKVPPEQVTKEQRSRAKAINFGLMYGQSSFGLAAQLKISRQEAKDYIIKYFSRFSKVKHYLDSLKEFAEEKGYTATMMNRKRFLPDIRSQNRTVKSMAQRMAINGPIQGSAADLIKLAMIDIQDKIKRQKLDTKMILQVHDELIFEVPEKELDIVKPLIKNSMENVAAPKLHLKVDMNVGVSWLDLK